MVSVGYVKADLFAGNSLSGQGGPNYFDDVLDCDGHFQDASWILEDWTSCI